MGACRRRLGADGAAGVAFLRRKVSAPVVVVLGAPLLIFCLPRTRGSAELLGARPPRRSSRDGVSGCSLDRFELCLQGVGFDGVGWRLFGTEFVDFPAVEGLHLVQGVSDGVAAARRRYVLRSVFVIGILRA